MTGTYKDDDGNEWTIEIKITYVVASDEVKKTKKGKDGDNVMAFIDLKTSQASQVGNGGGDENKAGNYIRMNTNSTADKVFSTPLCGLHETFHTLGLTDKWKRSHNGDGYVPDKGYYGDIIGDPKHYTRIVQQHWDAWGKYILKQGTYDLILIKRVN